MDLKVLLAYAVIGFTIASSLIGCTTTATFDAFGNKTSETKSFQITTEHIAALESLHAILLESVDAYVSLKGTIDSAEYEQELAEREAKAAQMAARIDALKTLLEALPKGTTQP